jgi:purine-cytosine permease-like protein
MSTTESRAENLDAATRSRLIETNGIDIITEAERTAKPRDLFWPWFAANVSVFGMSYAAFVYGFGVSFGQGVLVALIGIPLSFMLCGVIAIAGKRGSVPTMVLSRAAFGVHGQKVPGIISWFLSIGWETFLSIMAVLATATCSGGSASGRPTRRAPRRSWPRSRSPR